MNGSRDSSALHMPQLDALRGIAVLAVLVHHFLPVSRVIPSNFFTLGLLGVRLFFVLSGFLITGILLRLRSKSLGDALRIFYLRRAFRIFPIYYLTLAVAALAAIQLAREYMTWHVLYGSNILLTLDPRAGGSLSHLWSLSVEEQFYLLWPLMLLLTSTRYVRPLLLGTVGFGLVWKTAVAILLGDHAAGWMLMPACLDSLGLGGLLAHTVWIGVNPALWDRMMRRFLGAGLIIITAQSALFVFQIFLPAFWATQYLGVSLVFVWMIGRAAAGVTGPLRTLLDWRPLLYVGKVSYGVYLYHNFMPDVSRWILTSLHLPADHRAVLAGTATILTLMVAAISWRLVELPMNHVKDRITRALSSPRAPALVAAEPD